MQLEQRVLAAKEHKGLSNDLIQEYIPFISSCASKSTGNRFISKQSEELSVAMEAFLESIRAFDAGRGPFLPFAAYVIKCRLIDHLRSQVRHNAEVSTSFLPEPDTQRSALDIPDDSQQQAEPIRLEIDALSGELAGYHIGFMDLVKDSPKAAKTKRSCAAAINFILDTPEVRDKMHRLKVLPVTEISARCLAPRKILERHRKYIIAVVEILANDYPYLSEYVNCIRKDQKK